MCDHKWKNTKKNVMIKICYYLKPNKNVEPYPVITCIGLQPLSIRFYQTLLSYDCGPLP